jgi:hypothetical protein
MTRQREQQRSGVLTPFTQRVRLTGSWRTPSRVTSRTRTLSIQTRRPLSGTPRKRGLTIAWSAPAGCQDARLHFHAGTLLHPAVGVSLKGGETPPPEPSPTRLSLARGAALGAAPVSGENVRAAPSTADATGVGGGGASRIAPPYSSLEYI